MEYFRERGIKAKKTSTFGSFVAGSVISGLINAWAVCDESRMHWFLGELPPVMGVVYPTLSRKVNILIAILNKYERKKQNY